MTFSKKDLLEEEYYWNTNLLLSALAPSASFFNRFNGVDVLRMINLFNTRVTSLTISEGQTIERMLVREMPLQVNDEISVFNWLKKHYRIVAEKGQDT